MTQILTQNWIVFVVALIVSILLTFVPGLSAWWEDHGKSWKARVIILICLALSIAAFVLACFGITVGTDAYCPDYTNVTLLAEAAYTILTIALVAAGVVQTTYQFGLKPLADWLAALGEANAEDDSRDTFRG